MKYPHTAAYWPKISNDGFNEPSYSGTQTVKVRWEGADEKIVSESGEAVVSKAVVYTLIDIPVGSYLYLGVSNESDPSNQSGAYQVVKISKVSNLSGSREVIKTWLS